MNVIKIELQERNSGWVACLFGKSSPLLRPVPGNAYPASAAWWPTREEAVHELPSMLGADILVTHTRWCAVNSNSSET